MKEKAKTKGKSKKPYLIRPTSKQLKLPLLLFLLWLLSKIGRETIQFLFHSTEYSVQGTWNMSLLALGNSSVLKKVKVKKAHLQIKKIGRKLAGNSLLHWTSLIVNLQKRLSSNHVSKMGKSSYVTRPLLLTAFFNPGDPKTSSRFLIQTTKPFLWEKLSNMNRDAHLH